MQRGYDQFCPIAKAAEVVATRWTPLILRELMANVRTFNDIHRGIPLISTLLSFVVGIIVFLPFPGWQKLVGFITSASALVYGTAPLALASLRRSSR